MTVPDKILSREERKNLRSMARYWREVQSRADTSPLDQELLRVYNKLGITVLFIIARYIELTEEPDK